MRLRSREIQIRIKVSPAPPVAAAVIEMEVKVGQASTGGKAWTKNRAGSSNEVADTLDTIIQAKTVDEDATTSKFAMIGPTVLAVTATESQRHREEIIVWIALSPSPAATLSPASPTHQ